MHQRAILRREPGGELVVHADLSEVARGDTNDMVVNADGTAYVGNFGGLSEGTGPEADLVMVRPDGRVEIAAKDLLFPNGSVISADGRQLIVGESIGRRYRAFPIHADGTLGEGQVWAEVPGRAPDGCTLDAEGAIWFGDAIGHEIVRVREGGEVAELVETPDPTFACCLGGDDGRTMYLVTAATPPGNLEPGSGKLYRFTADVPHAGLP